MIGQTSGTVFLDQNPVSGKSSYYAKAIKGSLTGKEGSAKKITLPKATTKVTAKAKTDKTVVLSWKKVKGCRRYISVALSLESPLPDVIRHPAL